jgi:Zn ribbon nucleic-acid-binding protein
MESVEIKNPCPIPSCRSTDLFTVHFRGNTLVECRSCGHRDLITIWNGLPKPNDVDKDEE